MKICMVVSAAFPPREGMGSYVWNLSRYLINQGHQVRIITRGAAGQASHEVANGIDIWRPFFRPFYPFHVHLHSIFISKYIQRFEPEVDLFHSHSPLVPPIKTNRPVMLTFHSTIRDDIIATKLDGLYSFLMKLQEPFSYRLEVENLRRATLVDVVSPRVAGALRKYPHCPRDIPIIWNGVDTDIFQPKTDRPSKEGFILSVGRLGPGKGLEDLVDAISLIPDLQKVPRLVIIGDGPLRYSLEQRVSIAGLQEKIHFEGHVSDRNHLIGLYQEASLFVLPSHHEGLPTVILEAMACGCPVLATDVGGVPNVIEDGVNGILVPPKDPARMASAIQRMLADPEKSDKIGVRARHTMEQGFSWEKIGSKFVDLYLTMLQMGSSCLAS